jgi:hypothetical protein
LRSHKSKNGKDIYHSFKLEVLANYPCFKEMRWQAAYERFKRWDGVPELVKCWLQEIVARKAR